MHVEKLKYTIWAADTARAIEFYTTLFEAKVVRHTQHIIELAIAGGTIAIHDGGEGKKTWTGITFQVADVIAGAEAVQDAGGQCPHDPQPEGDEPPHLAMCSDTEGNQFMLTRART